jgi:spore coat protein A
MYPGEVTRVIATFDLAGMYVWHCHILSHEDHEMMRPYMVLPADAMPKALRPAYEIEQQFQLQTVPNPFSNNLAIRFNVKQRSTVTVTIYDSKGSLIKRLYEGQPDPGLQQFHLDGSGLSNGTYFCEVIIGKERMMRKLLLEK